MLVIGLTGGIASGKSTAARILASFGAAIVDADAISRQVLEPPSDALDAVAARFGAQVLQPDGTVDRARLGELVFADPGARHDLEAITHPAIMALSAAAILEASQTAPVVFYEAALLFESGRDRAFVETWLIALPEDLQLRRLMQRNGLSEAEALARVHAQMPLNEKVERATLTVWNDGDTHLLQHRLHAEWLRLLQRHSITPGAPA